MIVQINSISSETPTSDYIMVKDGQPEISSGELGTPPTATKSFGSRVLNPGFSLEPSEPPSETNHCSFSTGHCSFCRFLPFTAVTRQNCTKLGAKERQRNFQSNDVGLAQIPWINPFIGILGVTLDDVLGMGFC